MGSLIPGVPDAALGTGGITTLFVGIAIPLWRTWMAKQRTALGAANGEADWQKRQAQKLTEAEALVSSLLALRAVDAQLIAKLKLQRALALERQEILIKRLQRCERLLVELKPEFARFFASDFADLPVYDPEDDTTPGALQP